MDQRVADDKVRKFGISVFEDVSWGTHFCQFYQSKQDLIDILVPYFADGLKNNEYCMWITSQPLDAKDAEATLRNTVPNLDEYIRKGQIEILPYEEWYLVGGEFEADRVLTGLVQREKDALSRGFAGLRLTGNTFWIERNRWNSFVDYEAKVNGVIGSHRMIALCTYSLEKCTGNDVIDVVRNHRGTLIRTAQGWQLIEDVLERRKTEEELRDSEEKFRSIIENSQDVVMLTRADGIVTYLSPACFKVLGYNPEDLVGRQPWIIHPDDLEKVREVHFEALQGKRRSDFEYRVVTKTGEIKWVSHSWSPIIKNGQVQLIASTVRDITEHKKSEEAVQEARQNYSALFNNKSVGLAYCKVIMNERNEPVDFVFLDVNDTHGVLTGLKKENVIDKRVTDVIPGFAQSEINWRNRVALTGEDAHREIYEPNLKRWYDINVYSPKKGYFVSIFTDISDRKKAEEALRQSESLLHSFFDSPGAMRGIVEVTDGVHTRHLAANPEAARFYGLTQEPIQNQSGLELGRMPEHMDEQVWIEHYEQSRRSGQPVSFDYPDEQGDRRAWISVTVNYLGMTTDGKPRFAYVANDTTERKKAEAEIIRLASFPMLDPNPVVELDLDCNVHFSNAAANNVFPDIAKKRLDHPFLSDWKNVIHDLVVEKKPGVIREVKIGNEWFHQQFCLVPETQRVRIYALNINDLKRTEGELRKTRDYLDNLLNFANAPIIVWDPDFRITRFNHAFERLTGLSSSDVVGRPLDILFPKGMREQALGYIRRALAGEYWETVEIPILHTNGAIRTVLWNSANIYDFTGKTVVGTIAQGHDITDRKEAEEKLRETRDYLDNLLDYANAPIIVWNPGFKITKFNHAFERLTGLSAENALGKPLDILFPKDKRDEAMTHIQRALAGEYWESVEIPILHKDGAVRTLLWNSANICDPTKNVVATIAQGQDITERKKLEQELRNAERFSAIGQTAAMVGHDLRNPLQAIVGFIVLAEEHLNRMNLSDEKQEIKTSLKTISDQIHYMNKIVSDLQDFAQPIKPALVRTDVKQLVRETLSASKIPENVTVSIDIPKNLPGMKIDPTILRRVLSNLITNALQAMPSGGRLSLKAHRKTDPQTLIMSVEDTGLGIPKADRPKMFTPLFTTKSRGQGFGLPVCKRLIEAHGGNMTFKSRMGQGSKFTISIPLAKKSS